MYYMSSSSFSSLVWCCRGSSLCMYTPLSSSFSPLSTAAPPPHKKKSHRHRLVLSCPPLFSLFFPFTHVFPGSNVLYLFSPPPTVVWWGVVLPCTASFPSLSLALLFLFLFPTYSPPALSLKSIHPSGQEKQRGTTQAHQTVCPAAPFFLPPPPTHLRL